MKSALHNGTDPFSSMYLPSSKKWIFVYAEISCQNIAYTKIHRMSRGADGRLQRDIQLLTNTYKIFRCVKKPFHIRQKRRFLFEFMSCVIGGDVRHSCRYVQIYLRLCPKILEIWKNAE